MYEENYYRELLGVVKELKISWNEVMEIPISVRRALIAIHNKHIEKKKEDLD